MDFPRRNRDGQGRSQRLGRHAPFRAGQPTGAFRRRAHTEHGHFSWLGATLVCERPHLSLQSARAHLGASQYCREPSDEPGHVIKHGPAVYFNDDGSKSHEGEFSDNEKVGTWKSYRTDGGKTFLEYESEWKRGAQHGKETKYYASGKKEYEAEYVDGKMHGVQRVYREDGALRTVFEHDRGEVTKSTAHDEKGELEQTAQLLGGRVGCLSATRAPSLSATSPRMGGKLPPPRGRGASAPDSRCSRSTGLTVASPTPRADAISRYVWPSANSRTIAFRTLSGVTASTTSSRS